MKILLKSTNDNHWKEVEQAGYVGEEELQELLEKSPDLIPISEILGEEAAPFIVAIREFGLGSGSADLITFTADGEIAIIECKLEANPESKRKVIGQILEYGAALWRLPYDELDRRILKIKGKYLIELIRENSADFDESEFRSQVEDCLESGAFNLIIAVDEINDELKKIIEFQNGCASSKFTFSALELKRFKLESTEILVPHIYGPTQEMKESGKGQQRKQWTEEMLLETINENEPENAEIMKDLYLWSKSVNADGTTLGTGTVNGSFSFKYRQKSGKQCTIFNLFTDGKLQIAGWLNQQGHFENVRILDDFKLQLCKIDPRLWCYTSEGEWNPTHIEIFKGKKEKIEQFKAAVEQLGARVRS